MGTTSKASHQPVIRQENADSQNPVLQQVLKDLRETQMRYSEEHEIVGDAYSTSFSASFIRVHMQRDPESTKICHEGALSIFQEQRLAIKYTTTVTDIAYC